MHLARYGGARAPRHAAARTPGRARRLACRAGRRRHDPGSHGAHDHVRRPGRERRRRVVRRAAAELGSRRRDRARRVPDRLRLGAQQPLRRDRRRLLPARRRRPDHGAGRAYRGHPAHAHPRVRPPRRRLARRGRDLARAERQRELVGGPRHGRAARGRQGVPHVLARVGARDRRDLRRGLRAAPPRDASTGSRGSIRRPRRSARRWRRTSRTCLRRPCPPHPSRPS